jgi:hypothetical protein
MANSPLPPGHPFFECEREEHLRRVTLLRLTSFLGSPFARCSTKITAQSEILNFDMTASACAGNLEIAVSWVDLVQRIAE